MTIWRWTSIGLIALMLGCSSTYNSNQGDTFFKQKEYQKAMQAYIQTLQVRTQDGQRIIRYNPEMMTRLGIAAFNLNMFDGAIRVLKYVNQKTPFYGLAHFYLGLCYERQGKPKLAEQTYASYDRLNLDDPARDAMKGRLYFLQQQQFKKEGKLLASRGPGAPSTYSTQRIVVFDLYYRGSDLRGALISKGIASLAIEDLNKITSLQIIPRDRIQQLQQAMGWRTSDLTNAEKIENLQQMLNVGTVVMGELSFTSGSGLKINQRTITFTGDRQVKENTLDGSLQNIIVLEKKIVLNVLRDLGIQLTSAQITQLRQPATQSLNAFLYYSYAVHSFDQGKYVTGQEYLKKAIDIDPQFSAVERIIVSPDIFNAVQVSDWAVLQANIDQYVKAGSRGTGGAGYSAWVSLNPIDRLQEMGYYLDAGFIPGSDSRHNLEEIGPEELKDLFPELYGLPDPPDPPNQHYPEDPWFLPDPPAPPHRP